GKEPLEEQPTSKWEGNREQSDDTLEESSQPTQISKTEKHPSEQGNQGQESDSEAEGEDKAAGSKEHIPHTEQQDQEGLANAFPQGSPFEGGWGSHGAGFELWCIELETLFL
ncbi:hypothetical protein, partial [Klebsiella pneumoniae]|uniref:hypothetical protein n=1 Tax=Klebsiella pneumoniae TaxID=573 RepID=UPI003A803A25